MRILVVKLSSLGDALHALPAVAELATQLKAEIDWAVQPQFATLVRTFACVKRVYEVPRPSDFKGFCAALREIRKEKYDLVVDFQGLMKSAIVARSARCHRRIGPSFAREGSSLLYTEVAGKKNKARHAIEECLDIVTHLGLKMPETVKFPMNIPEIDLDTFAPLDAKGKRIAIAPMSRWESKNWPADYFAKLTQLLVKNHDARVYIIGGPGEKELADKIIVDAGVAAVNLCGRCSVMDSLSVLKRCEVLVSNDSGPMHMGAALGLKCVVPFGPTDDLRTGPYGQQHTILRSEKCKPCYKRECPLGTHICLKDITPEMVERSTVNSKQ